jgi:ribonuclease P protein component
MMQGSRDILPGEPDHDIAGVPLPRLGAVRYARLKKRAEFLGAARGQRTHSRSFTLQSFRRCEPSAEALGARFGLTVTKKVGGAVIRNRIRRRLREALKSEHLAPDGSHDYVIVARRDALTVRFSRLVDELARTLRQSRNPVRSGRGGRNRTGGAQDAAGPNPPQ